MELMPLAGLKHEGGFGPGGTTVAGIGYVSNKPSIINFFIGTKKGGAVDYATSLKNLRLSQIAKENKLTTINLVEWKYKSSDQDRVFNNYGAMFKEMSRRSKEGILTISVVFGNANSRWSICTWHVRLHCNAKGQARFFSRLSLVKMATNEESTDEELVEHKCTVQFQVFLIF